MRGIKVIDKQLKISFTVNGRGRPVRLARGTDLLTICNDKGNPAARQATQSRESLRALDTLSDASDDCLVTELAVGESRYFKLRRAQRARVAVSSLTRRLRARRISLSRHGI